MVVNDFIEYDSENITINGVEIKMTEDNILHYIVQYIQESMVSTHTFFRDISFLGYLKVWKQFPNRKLSEGMLLDAAEHNHFELVKYFCEKQVQFSEESLTGITAYSSFEIYAYLKIYCERKKNVIQI